MDRTTVQDALNPDCPIRNVLARIGDKWSLLVIVTLSGARTMRFGALQRAIPDISQKMLSVTLRTLEEDGYLTRQVYPEVPPVRCAVHPEHRNPPGVHRERQGD